MPVNSIQFGQNPWKYANGLAITNDAVTPDEIVNIGIGNCLDSTGIYQINVDAQIDIDNTVSGINGLDTGAVAASTLYAIHLIADPVTGLATQGILSLSATAPLLPFGYSIFKLVGYIATDATSNFLLGYWTTGNSDARIFFYDAPQATAVTAGAAVTNTAVALTALVPAIDNLPVWINYDMTPSAASRILSLSPFGATGAPVNITSQVTGVHVTGNALVLAKLNTAAPSIYYAWSAGGGDAVAINVAGYMWFM